MALQALWAPETQFQNKNGSILVQGKIYVQYRGRSQLAKTYRDPAGAYQNTNPLLTDNDGRVLCYADDAFSYTAVVCDFYGNELFSFDPIPCGSAGGGGSASAGTAEHWLGWNGSSVSVPSNTETRLRMPAGLDNVDYDGGFLKRIESSGTEMVLEEGLYLVNAVIRFQQSSSDLTNEMSNVVIHTRDFESANMQEVGATFRDEAGPDSSSDIHTISLTFIRHAYADDVGSNRLKFAVDTPNAWTSCYIQNLQIAKLGSSVNGGGTAEPYDPGQYISIENHVISVTGIEPDTYLTSGDLDGYATETWVSGQGYMKNLFQAQYGVTSYADVEAAVYNNKIVYCRISSGEYHSGRMAFLAYHQFYSPSDPRNFFEFQYYRSAEGSGTDSVFVYKIFPDNTWTTEERTAACRSDWNATSGKSQIRNKPDLSIYATISGMEEYVTEQTSAFITSADIPPIPEDVVTSAELANVSGAIEQDISDVTSAMTDALADKMDKSSSADFYPRYDNPEGYLTSVPSEYVTDTEMSEYVTEHTSAFITSADIPPIPEDVVTSGELSTVSAEIVNQIPSLDGYATEQYVQDYTSGFITSADVPEYSAGSYIDITNKTISVSPVKSLLAGENISIVASGNDYVISSQVPEDVVTSGELATVSGEIINQIPSLDGYATEQYVTEHTSAFITSADLPDVSDMATKTWVGEQGYLTSIPSEYVTETELDTELSGKADTSAIPDVSHFVTQEDIDAAVSGKMDSSEASAFYPMATNPSGYLVSTDLNGYATEQYVQDYTSGFVDGSYVSEYVASQVSGKQDELTFSYDASNKINAINGSALAGEGGGTTYSAGDNIDITDDVISVTDTSHLIAGANVSITSSGDDYVISSVAGSTYSAGQYISIAGDVISVTGVQPAGNYATQTYVDTSVAGKQDKLTFGYNGDGYINAINSSGIAGGEEGLPISAGPGIAISLVSGTILIETSGSGSYATEEYVDAAVSGKMDATESSAFYPMDTNPSGYLVSTDLNGYATEQYVTDETSAFITSADLPDLDGYATESWVSGQGYMKNLFLAEYGVTTFADIYDAYTNGKIVYCRLTSNQYGSGRMAFLAYVNLGSNPSASTNFFEFQYYRSNSTLSSNDSVFVYQIKPDDAWTTTERVAGNVSDWNATSGRTQILNKPELPQIKDLVAGSGISITTTSADVTIAADTSVLATQADLPDLSTYATQTWSTNNFFPIDGIQIVGSSAEASGANIIYIVSGSNA